MIETIRYVNSIGEEIVFGEGFWHYGFQPTLPLRGATATSC